LIEHCTTDAPPKECFDRLQGLVPGGRGPALFNSRDQFNHVSLANLMNAPADPGQTDFPA
jgi:hypothetical protein